MRVVVVGETWTNFTTISTGVDTFTFSSYSNEAGHLCNALKASGHDVHHMASQDVPGGFPESVSGLQAYDVVILSDIGANSLLLSPAVYEKSEPRPDRLEVLASWVNNGGGLLMIGGYLSFNGLEGKGRYGGTAVEEVLPVQCIPGDDRVEMPSGGQPQMEISDHPVVAGVPGKWPKLLGWSRTKLRAQDAEIIASSRGDPLIAVRTVGSGRTAIFASDCAPHWATDEFINWNGYRAVWDGIVRWLGRDQ